MKRLFRLILPVLLAALAFSQTAVVKRNVTLRPTASTDNDAITTLKPGTRATLLGPNKRNGYLHVKVGGQKGWVWARNVDVEEGEPEEDGAKTTKSKTDIEDTCVEGNVAGVTHVGPPELYPDPKKTPGCAATLDVYDLTKEWTENCPSGKETCTYSQSHRKVSNAERTGVYDEYDVPPKKRNIENGEVDHFYPLCAGGANTGTNLWYQPKNNDWNGTNFGFKEKDKLESWICKQIKARKMEPKDAFNRMTKDWVKFYIEEISSDSDLLEQIKDDEGDEN